MGFQMTNPKHVLLLRILCFSSEIKTVSHNNGLMSVTKEVPVHSTQ